MAGSGAVARGGRSETGASLVGRSAVPFELPDADGRVHRLDGYRGRWLLLVLHRHLF